MLKSSTNANKTIQPDQIIFLAGLLLLNVLIVLAKLYKTRLNLYNQHIMASRNFNTSNKQHGEHLKILNAGKSVLIIRFILHALASQNQ